MAIAEMQKVHMAVHKSVSDELMDKLQKLGCCQFIPQDHEQVEERDIASLRARLRHVENLLGEVRFAARFLDPYATNKGGGLAKAFGEIPEYSFEELARLASEEEFLGMAAKVREMEKRLSDAKSGSSRIAGLVTQLAPLAGLPYSLDFYSKGTESVSGAILSISKAHAQDLVASLASVFGSMTDVYTLPAGEKETQQLVSVIYPKDRANDFQEAVSKFQTARIDVPASLSGTAEDELFALDKEAAEFKIAEAEVIEEITGIANEANTVCQHCSDYWTIQKEKLDSLIEGEQTEQIQLFSFWIPKVCMAAFQRIVDGYRSLTEIVVTEPQEGELPPSLLTNKGLADPMEPLIEMYGTPTYGGLDPTAIVAPFFYMFFGICFGDAGYGLLIASLLIFLMFKKHITGTLRKFCQILIIGNICALVFGALTFSWFGDSITSFPFLKFLMPLQKLQILDPMNDPMTMLYFSLALGFVQIMVGLFIAMRENWKKGDRVAALADQGGWIVFLCGLVMVGLSSAGVLPVPTNVSVAVACAGALILVATQGRSKESIFGKLFSGILSLYNVTGYLGDVLSYSRLLALGLGSAAVGMVINLLANLVAGSVPVIGVVLGALIFILGHLFGIAVNILGAFIHALRLQYVEFFGKFYEASGTEFTPLRLSTQYVKLTENPETH